MASHAPPPCAVRTSNPYEITKHKYGQLHEAECPDGLRDYKPHVVLSHDQHAVGVGEHSSEHSGDVEYLFRPAPGAPTPRPRSAMPGEIGWGVPDMMDWAVPNTGQQIMLGSFRQIAEDRSTHEHMGCWYAHPEQQTAPGSDGYYRENIYSGRPDFPPPTPFMPGDARTNCKRQRHNPC